MRVYAVVLTCMYREQMSMSMRACMHACMHAHTHTEQRHEEQHINTCIPAYL